jgi:hypothetical protein
MFIWLPHFQGTDMALPETPSALAFSNCRPAQLKKNPDYSHWCLRLRTASNEAAASQSVSAGAWITCIQLRPTAAASNIPERKKSGTSLYEEPLWPNKKHDSSKKSSHFMIDKESAFEYWLDDIC